MFQGEENYPNWSALVLENLLLLPNDLSFYVFPYEVFLCDLWETCYAALLLSRHKLSTIVRDNCKVPAENHDLQVLLD